MGKALPQVKTENAVFVRILADKIYVVLVFYQFTGQKAIGRQLDFDGFAVLIRFQKEPVAFNVFPAEVSCFFETESFRVGCVQIDKNRIITSTVDNTRIIVFRQLINFVFGQLPAQGRILRRVKEKVFCFLIRRILSILFNIVFYPLLFGSFFGRHGCSPAAGCGKTGDIASDVVFVDKGDVVISLKLFPIIPVSLVPGKGKQRQHRMQVDFRSVGTAGNFFDLPHLLFEGCKFFRAADAEIISENDFLFVRQSGQFDLFGNFLLFVCGKSGSMINDVLDFPCVRTLLLQFRFYPGKSFRGFLLCPGGGGEQGGKK